MKNISQNSNKSAATNSPKRVENFVKLSVEGPVCICARCNKCLYRELQQINKTWLEKNLGICLKYANLFNKLQGFPVPPVLQITKILVGLSVH